MIITKMEIFHENEFRQNRQNFSKIYQISQNFAFSRKWKNAFWINSILRYWQFGVDRKWLILTVYLFSYLTYSLPSHVCSVE
jgi:hypothetical protein